MITLTVAPALRPYSAEGLLAMTWYSCTASTFGTRITVPPHGPLLMLAPSMVALLPLSRTPLAVTPMPCSGERKSAVPGIPLIPGWSPASDRTFRPTSGRSLIFFCSTTAEMSAFSVWMSGRTLVTWMVSWSVPGCMMKFTPSVAPTDTVRSAWLAERNPCNSATTV